MNRPTTQRRPPLVLALGGNALMQPGQRGTIPEQVANATVAMEMVAEVIARGNEPLLLTHGNGPQVGTILLRSELLADRLHALPLDICVADSQGGIGYTLDRLLLSALKHRGIPREVVTLLTLVEVDPDDPEFENPTKPIGVFYETAEARGHQDRYGWPMVEIPRRGWRRLVPSPLPRSIVESNVIKLLLGSNTVVIAAGGGGIPVWENPEGILVGVEAVVDKDRASALLARQVGAETLLIVTEVEQVCLNFGSDQERPLAAVSSAELRRWHDQGQFPPGSMGPKVEAVLDFLAAGGSRAIITDADHCLSALDGQAGTRVTP